jgi:hypothetical protein
MRRCKRYLIHFLLVLTTLSFCYSTVSAKDRGFDTIVQHLKTRYKAKRKSIPFLGLAKFAVKLVRPAGVKSFDVTMFENVDNSCDMTGRELNAAMRNALSAEWQPLVSVRSRNGEQTYVYAREAGDDIKLMVVNISRAEAVVVRVKLNPNALVKFMNDPKILGISLQDSPAKAYAQ